LHGLLGYLRDIQSTIHLWFFPQKKWVNPKPLVELDD